MRLAKRRPQLKERIPKKKPFKKSRAWPAAERLEPELGFMALAEKKVTPKIRTRPKPRAREHCQASNGPKIPWKIGGWGGQKPRGGRFCAGPAEKWAASRPAAGWAPKFARGQKKNTRILKGKFYWPAPIKLPNSCARCPQHRGQGF